MKLFLRSSLVASMVLLAANSSQAANIIVNGSFENPACTNATPCVPGGGWGLFESIPGWTSPGDLIEIGQGGIYGVTGFDGNQVLELDANNNAIVAQVVAGPGAFQLSFLYADRGHANTETFEVYWNGGLVNSFAPLANPPNSAMVPYTTIVLAVGGNNTLEFRGTGTSDSFGAIIDDVQLNQVPEDGQTAMLLGIGLFCLAAVRRFI